MNPFLEIPIGIVNSKQEQKETITRLRPTEIEYYYPGFYEGTVIIMKSGSSMLSTLSFDEVDAAIHSYLQYIKDHPGKFGNLQVKLKEKSNILHPVN